LGARLLILDAGSGASNNFIRSLRAGDPTFEIIGCNADRFYLKKSAADRNHLLSPSSRTLLSALRPIIKAEAIDLVIPTNDADALSLSQISGKLPCRTFVPRHAVVKRCHDKYLLTQFLRRRGIPAPLTYAISPASNVQALFERFAPRTQLWCRIRSGGGSYGAIPVRNADQVRSWIAYWEEMRAVPPGSFTLSEYLPGRDFCVQSLWDKGRLVLTKMVERITYMDTGSPSGVSSAAGIAKTAFVPRVIDACTKAVRALDAKASGLFFIDVKESAAGEPCITEINAGRFATMTTIHDLVGKHNMALVYVRLGLGHKIRFRTPYDYAKGYYFVRSVDSLPAIFREDELYQGIANEI
jgi:glutathione synthase/RimK-type ligase-like ATP-grasp enzyme